MHCVNLFLIPSGRVAPHCPHQVPHHSSATPELIAHMRAILTGFLAANLIHGTESHLDDMEAVEADLGIRKRTGHPFDVGRTHVDTNVFDLIRISAVCFEVSHEGAYCVMATSFSGE